MRFDDLGPWLPVVPLQSANLKAIGWFHCDDAFPQGDSSESFGAQLHSLSVDPWQPPAIDAALVGMLTAQLPMIDVLPPTGDRRMCDFLGSAVSCRRLLLVPGDGVIYIAPQLITHFVLAHGYTPPEEYRRAVMRSPMMSSEAYFSALKANTGEVLFEPIPPPPPPLCPHCGKELRSPRAQQCRHCRRDWHDPDNVRTLGEPSL